MSALPPKADMCGATSGCPLSANSGHRATYSINSSARPISVLGKLSPSAFAVFMLMIISTFVDLLDRQIGRLLALENPAGVDADQTVRIP